MDLLPINNCMLMLIQVFPPPKLVIHFCHVFKLFMSATKAKVLF